MKRYEKKGLQNSNLAQFRGNRQHGNFHGKWELLTLNISILYIIFLYKIYIYF